MSVVLNMCQQWQKLISWIELLLMIQNFDRYVTTVIMRKVEKTLRDNYVTMIIIHKNMLDYSLVL